MQRDLSYMTEEQREKFSSLCRDWGESKDLKPADLQRIEIMACVAIEIEKLQAFVNLHSPTYQVIGKSGDRYSRARPEFQQLQELRQRMSVLIDRLQENSSNDSGFDFITD